MALQYVLVSYDINNNVTLNPQQLTVHPGDYVMWICRLDSNHMYQATNFTPSVPQLFPQTSYLMPGSGDSAAAQVQPNAALLTPYTYTCASTTAPARQFR
jgi:plastocyanin